jgi:uncharacterized protein (TIGR03437 family)
MKKLVGLFVFAASLFAQTAETIPFRAIMLPSNEVPAIAINASGAATIWLHVVRDAQGNVTSASTDFNVSFQFPADVKVTGLHIHKGKAGENGPVTIDSTIKSTDPVSTTNGRGTVNLQGQTPATNAAGLDTVNGMLTDPSGFYVNLHTTDNPSGVIRGQLQRAEMVVLMGRMSPLNEVPPITDNNASAFGTVIAIATCDGTPLANCATPTSGQVIFDANYSGFPEGSSFSGFHIHSSPAGVNGPVTINTGISGGANAIPANPAGGILHYEVEVPVATPAAASTLAGLFQNPAGYYINIHTLTNPNGVIRAQLRNTDRMQFKVNMSTSSEVPPITDVNASAPAVVNIHTIRSADGSVAQGVAIFDVNYRFPGAETFTGLHIHNGKAGENGPVTINTGLSGTSSVTTDTGAGNIYRIVYVNNTAGLATLNSLVANPEFHYVNLHTTTRPNGVVRSQLVPLSTAVPTISGVISSVSDPNMRTVAPGGLMTIFGSNLVKTESDIRSFSGEKLPVSFNGVRVTVGGKPAALLVLQPSFIVAQVPVDAAQGNQSVVTRTGNGEVVTAATVQVANVAPAFYFDANGGVFTKLDYSLVSASNAAQAGDLIWGFGTGFGALTGRAGAPSLNTGDLPAIGALYDTAPVTLTVGGREAKVMATVATPGYAGLYQVLFEVPQGVTGNAPVIATMGSTRSNSVNLAVR